MAEPMHRNLSEKLRALPSHRSGSFWTSGDWNEDSFHIHKEEYSTRSSEFDQLQSWAERWRAVAKFETTYPYCDQKVVVDVGVTTSYRREGRKNYIVGGEINDPLWDSNMFVNDDEYRGWFIDELVVQFEPLWRQDEIVTGGLYPKTANTCAYFGHSKQSGVTTGFIGRNPTIAVNMTNTRSQQTSQPMYTCRWERGPDGVMSLHWKLNLWCPSSNNNNREYRYPKLYNSRQWSGFKAPRLPPDYENGNFNGLDFKPRIEWVVPASVVRTGRAAWRVTIRARLTCVSSKKSWLFFATDRRFAQEEMHHQETWRFPGNFSGHVNDWLLSSTSRCNSSSSRSAHHGCRS